MLEKILSEFKNCVVTVAHSGGMEVGEGLRSR